MVVEGLEALGLAELVPFCLFQVEGDHLADQVAERGLRRPAEFLGIGAKNGRGGNWGKKVKDLDRKSRSRKSPDSISETYRVD